MSTQHSAPLDVSVKQRLVLTAERLYAMRGLEGVPLRQIGVETGMANRSAVQYHFGSKGSLVAAILVNRLEALTQRRKLLLARAPIGDVRRVVEAQLLPWMELAEDRQCYYMPFLDELLRCGHPLDTLPADHLETERAYYKRIGALIEDVPEPLRDIRINQASLVCLHACADRHRMRTAGASVISYGVHVSQLLDNLVAFLTAPPSAETLAALQDSETERPVIRDLP
jgi:AcrR family transcriptional regulator